MKRILSLSAVVLAAVVVPLASAALIKGTAGNDTLTGTSARDYIHGYAGDDTIVGSAGRDYAWGGAGTTASPETGVPTASGAAPETTRLPAGTAPTSGLRAETATTR